MASTPQSSVPQLALTTPNASRHSCTPSPGGASILPKGQRLEGSPKVPTLLRAGRTQLLLLHRGVQRSQCCWPGAGARAQAWLRSRPRPRPRKPRLTCSPEGAAGQGRPPGSVAVVSGLHHDPLSLPGGRGEGELRVTLDTHGGKTDRLSKGLTAAQLCRPWPSVPVDPVLPWTGEWVGFPPLLTLASVESSSFWVRSPRAGLAIRPHCLRTPRLEQGAGLGCVPAELWSLQLVPAGLLWGVPAGRGGRGSGTVGRAEWDVGWGGALPVPVRHVSLPPPARTDGANPLPQRLAMGACAWEPRRMGRGRLSPARWHHPHSLPPLLTRASLLLPRRGKGIRRLFWRSTRPR